MLCDRSTGTGMAPRRARSVDAQGSLGVGD